MELKIDVSDWEQEARQAEVDMSTEEQAIKSRIEQQLHPAKAARLYIVARELGMADPEMLPPNKINLMVGTAYNWSQMEAHKYQLVQLDNGKVVRVRSLIHPVPLPEPQDDGDEEEAEQLDFDLDDVPGLPLAAADDNPSPVYWNDEHATDRATSYIMKRVPGFLYGRFKVIAANKGDVFQVWREFSDQMEATLAGLV